MDRKIILFELNEVPSRIFDYFCSKHPNSTVAQKLNASRVYDTYAEDKALSPWVTWPTVHRGVADDQHGILNFGQPLKEVDRAFPPIWKILTERGVQTGLFGSLHSHPPPTSYENYSFYMPDTFAAGSECFPDSIRPFQTFNLAAVKASPRNVSRQIPWKEALDFLWHLPDLGLKPSTLADTARHVVSEQINSARRVRRRTYQVVLAFDVFMKQLHATQPAFCTFFTNHVASSMHRYWAALFPEDYAEFGYSEEWVDTYRQEIDFTMGKFEEFFKRLVTWVDAHPEYQLWVTTSMGQAATVAQPLYTQLYLTDLEKFMTFFGFERSEWERRPAMEPQVNVTVPLAKVTGFVEELRALEIGGKPVPIEVNEGFVSMTFGQPNLRDDLASVSARGAEVTIERLGLSHVDIEDLSTSSAYHIPQGRLYIYDPKQPAPAASPTLVSTRDIAPSLLKNYGIAAPDYMKGTSSL